MKNPASTLDVVPRLCEQLSAADQLLVINKLSERLRQLVGEKYQTIDNLTQAGLGAELWQE